MHNGYEYNNFSVRVREAIDDLYFMIPCAPEPLRKECAEKAEAVISELNALSLEVLQKGEIKKLPYMISL